MRRSLEEIVFQMQTQKTTQANTRAPAPLRPSPPTQVPSPPWINILAQEVEACLDLVVWIHGNFFVGGGSMRCRELLKLERAGAVFHSGV